MEFAYSAFEVYFVQKNLKILLVFHVQQIALLSSQIEELFSCIILDRRGQLIVQVHDLDTKIPLYLNVSLFAFATEYDLVIPKVDNYCLSTGSTVKVKEV